MPGCIGSLELNGRAARGREGAMSGDTSLLSMLALCEHDRTPEVGCAASANDLMSRFGSSRRLA